MDEGLDYSSEEQMQMHRVSSGWALGRNARSVESLGKDPSKLYLQYKNFHLHLVQQMEHPSMHPMIPSTKAERYSYYRSYLTSPNKCLIVSTSIDDFNTMFWAYIYNVFFKTVSHTYTHLFLASYSPEAHLFLPKMVPFSFGARYAFLLTSIFEILLCFNNALLLFGYLMHGMANKNPWNRCDLKTYEVDNHIVNCADLSEFNAIVKNSTWKFKDKFFITSTGFKFNLVQVEHFRHFFLKILDIPTKFMYFVILWSAMLLFNKLIYRRVFWQIQHRLQLIILLVEISLCLYLIHSYFYETHAPELTHGDDVELDNTLGEADIDFLSESVTAPPVLHVLTARSTQDILPSYDSLLICLSNAACFLFRGILMNRIRNHCKNLAGAPLQFTHLNPYSWFYFWTLFYSQFYWGDLYSLSFLTLHFLVDFLTLVVTYRCTMEVIICEWTYLKEWAVNMIAAVICLAIYLFTHYKTQLLFHLYTKGVATFLEIFVIYYVYPAGRLIDDVIFHFGAPPTTLRRLVWRCMPVYYFVKLYIMIDSLSRIRKLNQLMRLEECVLVFLPYVAGIIIIIYKYTIKDKRNWQRMFVPDSNWGPQEHQIRHLRKEFASRTYIGSQAIRHLSRYMMNKRESKTFELNLNYDPNRHSTMAASMFRMEADKKDT